MMLLGAFASGSAAAESAPAESAPAEAEARPEVEELPHLVGPRQVDLGHQIELDLPAGFSLYERAQAQELLRRGGNDTERVVGLVFQPDSTWILVISYEDSGYVSDADADELEPGELLESYRRGTAQQNIKRRELGIPELQIDGWSEQPRYERARHHLVWGLQGHSTEGPVINHFTNALGRHGYLSLALIDDPSAIERSKGVVQPILTALRFRPGATYEDYREGDPTSDLGLRALILGGTGVAIAKKTGILVAILAVFKKGFVVIALGIAGVFKWLFSRRRRSAESESAADSPTESSG